MTDIPGAAPILERTIAAVLDAQVATRPDSVALIETTTQRALTYAELQQAAFRTATALADLGVARGEPVAVMLDNHIDHVTTWAGLGVGAMVAVPINTAYKGEMLRHIISHSGARVAIVEAGYLGAISQVLDDVPELTTIIVRGHGHELPARITRHDFTSLHLAEPHRPEPPHVSDVCTIIYTSGTEGPAKGVLCPHGHAYLHTVFRHVEPSPSDVWMVVTPLFHSMGLFVSVYGALRGGGRAVLAPFTASGFWDEVRRYHCNKVSLIGAMTDFLWRQETSPQDADNPLEHVFVVPAMPFINEFAERFAINVTSGFGQSETGPACLTSPEENRPLLCGRPLDWVDMKIVDDDDIEVPRGITGEIVVRSNEPWSTFLGYHRDADITVRAWRNNWLHTGDAAFQQEDGQFVFVDRKKDALRRRGENVSSTEVEAVLVQRPDVESAAIVAVPSEHSEDDIKAVLILTEGAAFDPEAILRDMVDRLPYFMVPRYYEAVESLPMTGTFKVQKGELRKVGITEATWDCEAHGLTVTRHGLKEAACSP